MGTRKLILPLVLGVILLIPYSSQAFAGEVLPSCDKTWVGGEGNWEDATKWIPVPPTSGFSEVVCIDDGNIANSVVHLNSDFNVALDIIVDSGDKLVIESGWTLTHGELNLSYHNNGILQIFGSYVQFGSIFFNSGSVIVECGGSFDIFSGILDGPEPIFQECFPVGGELIPLDTTMVLVAGTHSFAAWMIPAIVSAIGIAIVIARKF